MTLRIVVTGTDTDVGKTVFCAGLAGLLGASYWKPVQAGLNGETDSIAVARLGELPAARILPEAYQLRTPCAPHRAAEIDAITIDPDQLVLPATQSPLVIEGAGGLLVPLNRYVTIADLFARWRVPVVLCASTRVGTINHTLLSLEALRRRSIPVIGVALIGEDRPEAASAIIQIGHVSVLGRLPWLDPLTPQTLQRAFHTAFRLEDFTANQMAGRCAPRSPNRSGGE